MARCRGPLQGAPALAGEIICTTGLTRGLTRNEPAHSMPAPGDVMDLGIRGRRAVVCGGSKGLGLAAARSLAREGVDLTLVARSQETLDTAARQLAAEAGVKVATVSADLGTAEGRAAVLRQAGIVDILVANPGIRQVPDNFRTLTREAWDGWMEAHFFSSLE